MDNTGLGNDLSNPRDKPTVASSGRYDPWFGKVFFPALLWYTLFFNGCWGEKDFLVLGDLLAWACESKWKTEDQIVCFSDEPIKHDIYHSFQLFWHLWLCLGFSGFIRFLNFSESSLFSGSLSKETSVAYFLSRKPSRKYPTLDPFKSNSQMRYNNLNLTLTHTWIVFSYLCHFFTANYHYDREKN